MVIRQSMFGNILTFVTDLKVPMERNFQVGDNNIKVMFDIASLDCESLRMYNEIEVCLFSVWKASFSPKKLGHH